MYTFPVETSNITRILLLPVRLSFPLNLNEASEVRTLCNKSEIFRDKLVMQLPIDQKFAQKLSTFIGKDGCCINVL